MIVKLEVTASEKVSARSQYENNNYSVLISVENLEVSDNGDIQAAAEDLFRRAKDAIAWAQFEDGLEVKRMHHDNGQRQLANGHVPSAPVAAPNGQHAEHQASSKQWDLIKSLAKRAGLDESGLHEFAHKAVEGLDNLTKFNASRLINALQHIQVPAQGRAR